MSLGDLFERFGDLWHVTVVTDTFLIATRAAITGEPDSPDDLIKIARSEIV